MDMKAPYFIFLLAAGLALACTDNFPEPSKDISDLNGSYRTNGLLDFSCVAITDERQLPTLSITRETGGTYQLTRTEFLPTKRSTKLTGVTVQVVPDTLFLFRENKKIGNLSLGTMRVVKGKKTQDVVAPLLLVSVNDTTTNTYFFYYGYRE